VKIIIDTHILLWSLADPDRLRDAQRRELETRANTIFVSSVSIAEIMIKASLGKLDPPADLVEVIEESGFEFLDFSASDAFLLKDLPYHHRDPFDRMLIAQSLARDYFLMSDDEKIRLYACRVM
jgi:PIN domain nuclease of toxin-antitoxin system